MMRLCVDHKVEFFKRGYGPAEALACIPSASPERCDVCQHYRDLTARGAPDTVLPMDIRTTKQTLADAKAARDAARRVLNNALLDARDGGQNAGRTPQPSAWVEAYYSPTRRNLLRLSAECPDKFALVREQVGALRQAEAAVAAAVEAHAIAKAEGVRYAVCNSDRYTYSNVPEVPADACWRANLRVGDYLLVTYGPHGTQLCRVTGTPTADVVHVVRLVNRGDARFAHWRKSVLRRNDPRILGPGSPAPGDPKFNLPAAE